MAAVEVPMPDITRDNRITRVGCTSVKLTDGEKPAEIAKRFEVWR